MTGSTERLWQTRPGARTALGEVIEVRGKQFRLDRSPYCPQSQTYRHVQQPDRGTIWRANGEKRKLAGVYERNGQLWHQLRDVVPDMGERLNMHIDGPRREETSRAHTGLHLFLMAAMADRCPALSAVLEVRGSGTARLEFAEPYIDARRLAAWLARANQEVAADRRIEQGYVPRDAAGHTLLEQPFADGVTVPGPEHSLAFVGIEGVGALPCDGTHATRTSELGALRIRHAHANQRGGFVVVIETERPARRPV